MTHDYIIIRDSSGEEKTYFANGSIFTAYSDINFVELSRHTDLNDETKTVGFIKKNFREINIQKITDIISDGRLIILCYHKSGLDSIHVLDNDTIFSGR